MRRLVGAAADKAPHFTVRVLLALRLAEYRTIAGEYQAGVVQGAGAYPQGAALDIGFR
ncbi:hypothetical protein D3C76_1369120 [compost metagenome]